MRFRKTPTNDRASAADGRAPGIGRHGNRYETARGRWAATIGWHLASWAVLFLVNSLREPEHESLRQAFKEHILRVLSPDFTPIAEVFDHPEDPMTTRERLKNWYEEQQAASHAEGVKVGVSQGVQQGIKQGVQQGVKQGLQRGRAEGQRTLLAKQLRLKFGSLDASAKARLADATSDQLVKWAERVLTAGSLDEIWA